MDSLKRTPLNSVQKEILVDFLVKHAELRSGRFTATFTKKTAQHLWEELTEQLNSVPNGARKSWVQWRKTWQDQKKNTKSKIAKARTHANGTGGGAPIEEFLTPVEASMLPLISTATISGDPEVQESAVPFEFASGEDDTYIIPEIIEVDSFTPASPERGTSDMAEVASCSKTHFLEPSEVTIKRKAPRVPLKVKRFTKSLAASEKFLESCDNRSKHLENYHNEKLRLLKLQSDRREAYQSKKLKLLEEKNKTQNNILNELQKLNNLLSHSMG